jgi:serine/threonine-protein kinase HipA
MYVFNNSRPIGVLDRSTTEANCFVFHYLPEAKPSDMVSLMMPVGPDQYRIENHLHPVFQSNLPEGQLRRQVLEMLKGTLAYPDEFSILQVVGHSQIGRLRFAETSTHIETAPKLDLSNLLAQPGTEGLLSTLLEEYATWSGVAGVQPKVLVRADETGGTDRTFARKSSHPEETPRHLTVRGTTHIVKTFDAETYPELATNEFFSMRAAQLAGLPVPRFDLSQDRTLLIVERFDMAPDGHYLGFEDFCSLYVMPSDDKYESSYERVAKRIKEMVSPQHRAAALTQFFTSFALTCAVRNGDAHLKNFGVLYDDPAQGVQLAPVFDIVCTQAYVDNDPLALTLNGSKRYPKHADLVKFGRLFCDLSATRVREALDAVAHGVHEAALEMEAFAAQTPAFVPVAQKMMAAWESGINLTCRPVDRPLFILPAVADSATDSEPDDEGEEAYLPVDRPAG